MPKRALPRRLICMSCSDGAFAAANALSALAPDILSLTGTRVLAGMPHGAFLGIAMLLAASLLPPERRSAGVAQILMGLTLANVIGVPIAGAFGCRWCFAPAWARSPLTLCEALGYEVLSIAHSAPEARTRFEGLIPGVLLTDSNGFSHQPLGLCLG